MVTPRAFSLTGPSGSGKSTVVSAMLAAESGDFRPVLIPKFTTRPTRSDDGPEAISVPSIPSDCDLVYEQYGVRYGFGSSLFFQNLAAGSSPIVIVNDVRVVEDLRQMLGPNLTTIYVYREAPSLARYTKLIQLRGDDETQVRIRFEKARAIHRIYIEHIELFDRVILNVKSIDRTEEQVRAIVSSDPRVELRPFEASRLVS